MKKLLALIPALALLAPAAAEAAPPNPFGHACTPQNGVLFCPTANDAQRVPSWDGVPLDVDVTLPPTRRRPVPDDRDDARLGRQQGQLRVDHARGRRRRQLPLQQHLLRAARVRGHHASARGFGRSCGAIDSRTSPGCDRGWVRLADHRYEGRDVQYLLGLLVDQGVVNPDEIGVTGISYGGIQSLNLARLRNRIRLPNGSYRRWRSPEGTKLSIAAAYPRWGGSDMTYALQPNGRFLDFRDYHVGQSIEPGGVQKQSYVERPVRCPASRPASTRRGAAPFSADLTALEGARPTRGEPETAQMLRVGRELTGYHSIAGLTGVPAPLLVQNGWTDDLFPADEALRVWRIFRKAKGARVTLQFGDLGHPRGANKPAVDHVLQHPGRQVLRRLPQGRRARGRARAR